MNLTHTVDSAWCAVNCARQNPLYSWFKQIQKNVPWSFHGDLQ